MSKQRSKMLPHVYALEPRGGFTLVEMLVSVALVLLMMTLFSSIFSMAANSVATQRGISQNDQRARALSTLIRADFAHRTMRYVFPYSPSENAATSPTPFSSRTGYLYISTNDAHSGLDDLVQFTVSSNILTEDPDGSPYFGRAVQLLDPFTNSPSADLRQETNQPDADDGSVVANGTGSSTAAEVAYFVRNGNLYRRVMLLRDPLPIAGRDLNEQPTSVGGNRFLGHPTGNFRTLDGISNDFWLNFDYSAIWSSAGASFLGASALSNENSAISPGTALGDPRSRFGFNPVDGRSREHTCSLDHSLAELQKGNFVPKLFLGRFVHAETSASNFNWPQSFCTDPSNGNVLLGGNPFSISSCPLRLNTNTGVVDEFSDGARGGERRMEDLVLAGVHEFKVEIWDQRLQKYSTPGHRENTIGPNDALIRGDYHRDRRFSDWGPDSSVNAKVGVFDTWHPGLDLPNGIAGPEEPPFLPLTYTPPVFPRGPTRLGLPNDNFGDYWKASAATNPGAVVFVPWLDSNGDNVFAWSEIADPKFQIALRCVRGGQSGTVPPVFPSVPGRRVTDGEVEWESFDNRRPLRSVRLTIRYQDQSTDTQRTLSLVIPLTEKR